MTFDVRNQVRVRRAGRHWERFQPAGAERRGPGDWPVQRPPP